MRYPMPNHPCDFEIPDDWLREADILNFLPTSPAYHSEPDVVLVPLLDIEPPYRRHTVGKDWRGFDRGRLVSVLKGVATGAKIEPVPLRKLPEPIDWYDFQPYAYRVRDGFHRFYASIAAGFRCIPANITEINP